MSEKWYKTKNSSIEKLKHDIKIGRVDKDILWILELINSLDNYYTTSSCSGRIQITVNYLPGEKFSLITLAKWHHIIKLEDLLAVLENTVEENIWFAVQPPILHIACRDLSSAKEMLKHARNNGFKHAGIQGLTENRIMVEITSTERIEAPLRLNGAEIYKRENLDYLVKVANNLLIKSKTRLVNFGFSLSRIFLKKKLPHIESRHNPP